MGQCLSRGLRRKKASRSPSRPQSDAKSPSSPEFTSTSHPFPRPPGRAGTRDSDPAIPSPPPKRLPLSRPTIFTNRRTSGSSPSSTIPSIEIRPPPSSKGIDVDLSEDALYPDITPHPALSTHPLTNSLPDPSAATVTLTPGEESLMPALLRSATGKYTPARVAAWRAFLDQCRYEDEASQRLTQDPLPVPTGAALRPVPRGPEPPQPLSSNPPGLISVIPSSSSASSLSSSINTNVNPSIAAQQQRKRQANQRLLRQQQAHRAMQRHQKLELAEIEEELAENAVGVRDFAHERAAVNEQSQRQIRQDQELQLRLEQRQENQQKEQEKLSQEIQQELQNLVQEYRQLCIKRHRGPLVPQDEDRYRYLRNMTGPDTRSRVTRYRSSGSSSIDRMSPRERLVRLEFRRLISEDPYFDYTEEERKEELRKGRKKGNESSSAGGASVRMRDQQYASRQQYDHHLPNGGKNIDQNGKQPDLDEKDEESKTGGDEGKNSAVPAKKEDGVLDKVWFWARRKST